jgi:ADP-ribose pyrophosphatase
MAYERLNTEVIYRGHAFSVLRILVNLPDDSQKHYDLVEHKGSVTLVPINENGDIYFVRQYRIGAKDYLLELPAGVLEPDEDPAEGACREMREETGMAANQLLKIGDFYMAPGYSDEFLTIYLATGLYASPLSADVDEFLELVLVPAEKAMAMAENGQIQDGKSLAALMLAKPHLTRLFGEELWQAGYKPKPA